ncbi:MAG: tetratricopeptide repeat protein [Polyangiaceae bacterium]
MPDPEHKTDPEAPAGPTAPEGSGDVATGASGEAGETGGAAEGDAQGDRFNPEAIAARVNSLGEETEEQRIARTEEGKLLERRKEQKKGGKSALESAASKRLAKIGEGTVRRPGGALAGVVTPEADPLVDRAVDFQKWISDNRSTFTSIVVVAALGVAGVLGYTYWQDKRNADASAMLARAFADEHGHVSDKEPDEDEDESSLTKELYPTFKTSAERRDAAIAQCRTVESKYPGTGAAILARLSEASLLLDSGDAKASRTAYDDVRSSALAKADVEVRGRAIEGVGFAEEALAQSDAGDRAKHIDAALAAYKDLAQVDAKGLKDLGLYHQARVLVARAGDGDKAKAIELLKDAHKDVSDPGDTHAFPYLEFVVEDRLRDLDPTALPPKELKFGPGVGGGGAGAEGLGGGGGGKPDMNDPRIQKLLQQLREQQGGKGGGAPIPMPIPAPGAPGDPPPRGPAPAPGSP